MWYSVYIEPLEIRCFLSVSPLALQPQASSSPSAVVSPKATTSQGLSAQFDSSGLSKIVYNGTTLYDGQAHPDDRFLVGEYTIVEPNGSRVTRSGFTPLSSSWNSSTKTLTLNYGWGSVACKYVIGTNRITMQLSVTNRSSNTIAGVNVYPMSLRFPNAPTFSEGVGVFPHEEPPVLPADYGSGVAALVGEDVVRNEYIAMVGTGGSSPDPTRYTLRLGSTSASSQPTGWPLFDRPIAPGATDSYTASIRFAPEGTPASTIGSDIYSKFAKQYPYQLRWSDKRAIGTLFLASPTDQTSTNPRGWTIANDGGGPIDVTTPQGLANFRTRILAYADRAVAILKSMNAQGMIVWDLEGEQYANADYIGDPTQAATLAPEWAYQNTIGDFFKKFTDAGLRVGVTARADQLVYGPNGPTQQPVPDSQLGSLLSQKISYAQQNWGASLFYLDSTNPHTDSSVFRGLANQFPTSLLIPENQNTADYAVGAPYDEARSNMWSTPADVRAVYPKSFSVINSADVPMNANSQSLLNASVKQGNILLFQGWWNNPINSMVKTAYGG